MNFFDVNSIITTILGYPLSYLELIGTISGLICVWLAAKQNILTWLRQDLEVPPYLSPELMPQGGWLETCEAEEIALPLIWAKVEELSKGTK